VFGNIEIYLQTVRKKYTTFSTKQIVALRSVNLIFPESYDFAASIVSTSSGNSKSYCYALFVFSEIIPDDHDMKARLNAFSYGAAEFSYDGIRYDAMMTIKFESR
jgi:hypothetical protein